MALGLWWICRWPHVSRGEGLLPLQSTSSRVTAVGWGQSGGLGGGRRGCFQAAAPHVSSLAHTELLIPRCLKPPLNPHHPTTTATTTTSGKAPLPLTALLARSRSPSPNLTLRGVGPTLRELLMAQWGHVRDKVQRYRPGPYWPSATLLPSHSDQVTTWAVCSALSEWAARPSELLTVTRFHIYLIRSYVSLNISETFKL